MTKTGEGVGVGGRWHRRLIISYKVVREDFVDKNIFEQKSCNGKSYMIICKSILGSRNC